MKKSCAVLILAFVVGLTALAQPQRRTPQERTDQLAKELSLTEEQKAKVLDLYTEQEKNFQRPSGEMQGDREAWRAAMQKRREEMNQKMKGILTPEQYAKYENMRLGGPPPGRGGTPLPGEGKQPPPGMGEQPAPGKGERPMPVPGEQHEAQKDHPLPPGKDGKTPPAPPTMMTPQDRTEELAKRLGLTAEQKTKVLDLYTSEDAAMQKAIKEEKGDPAANRQAMEKMRKETDKKMKSILTKKQYQQYQKMAEKKHPPKEGATIVPPKVEKKEK